MFVIARAVMATAVLFASSVAAQSTSVTSDRAATIKGDADKIVCQKQERIGSRIAAKKVCLTVREWQLRAHADRQQTEGVQAGVRTRCENCPTGFGKVF